MFSIIRKTLAIMLVCVLVFASLTCGGGGGGGESGGVDVAFVSGNVSYPSSGLTKPYLSADGFIKHKVTVTADNLVGIPFCPIKVYGYDSTGVKTLVVELVADETGNYSISEEQLGAFKDELVMVTAEFNSPVSDLGLSMSQFLNLSDPDAPKTGVSVNPLTEAIIQQVIASLTDLGITLNPEAMMSIALFINSISTQLNNDLAAGLEIEVDETNLAQGYDGAGAAMDLIGSGSNTAALFAGMEADLISSSVTTASVDVIKEKLIGFLCVMGFKVGNGSGGMYSYIPPSFFVDQADGTKLSPADFSGISPAFGYGVNIYLVDPTAIFVDANTDGEVDATTTFTQVKKAMLYGILSSSIAFSDEFVTDLTAKVGTSIKLKDVAKVLSENFIWAKPQIVIGEQGQPIMLEVEPLSPQSGGSGILPSELLAELEGEIPATPFEFAEQYCSDDAFLMYIAPEIVNDALYKGFVANTGFNPDIAIFKEFLSWDTVREFLMDDTKLVNGRAPIWDMSRDRVQASLYAGMPSALFGTTLTGEEEINPVTAFLFTLLATQRYYLVDQTEGWYKTMTKTVPIVGSISWVEPRWENYKLLSPAKSTDTLENMFKGLLGSDFTPATFQDAIAESIWSYADTMNLDVSWFKGLVKPLTLDAEMTIYVSHQVAQIDPATGLAEPAGGLTVKLFSTNGSGIMQGSALQETVTDATEGTFEFDNLTPDGNYAALVYSPSLDDPVEFQFMAGKFGGQISDSDDDGDIDRIKLHFGWVKGDPTPMSGSTTEDRTYKLTLPPTDGWFALPNFNMFSGSSVDFSASGTAEFLLDTDGVYDLRWTPSAADAGAISSGTGVALYQLNMSGLGLGSIEGAKLVGGNSTSFDSIADYEVGATSAASLTISNPYDDENNYFPLVFLADTNEQIDTDYDGTGEDFVWLVEVVKISDYVMSVKYAILHQSGKILVPSDPLLTAEDFFPMQVNDKRYYIDETYQSGDLVSSEAVIEKVGSVGALPVAPSAMPFQSYSSIVSTTTKGGAKYYAYDTNGDLKFYGLLNDDGSVIVFDEAVVILDSKVQVGQLNKYSNVAVARYPSLTSMNLSTAGTATITVAATGIKSGIQTLAGVFDNCLQVYYKVQWTAGTESGGSQSIMYFANGVGLVLESKFLGGFSTGEMSLAKAVLSGSSKIAQNYEDSAKTVEMLYAPNYQVTDDGFDNYSVAFSVRVFEQETEISSVVCTGTAMTAPVALSLTTGSGVYFAEDALVAMPGADVDSFTFTVGYSDSTESTVTFTLPMWYYTMKANK